MAKGLSPPDDKTKDGIGRAHQPDPILCETAVGADVMKPIAFPLVGGMITSTIHVLILARVFSP
jgi:hypothetical protein